MFGLAQILAVIIFAVMFAAIVLGRVHRFIPALAGAALTIVVVFLAVSQNPDMIWSTLNLGQLGELNFWIPGQEHIESQGVNWQTIIFIGGMKEMVEGRSDVAVKRLRFLY